jgi:hypothetical protein
MGFLPLYLATVASRPKILLNNSKPAAENNDCLGEFSGRMAADFWQKLPKTGGNKY